MTLNELGQEDIPQAKVPMPKYKCHKEVWALKIKEVLNDDTVPGGIVLPAGLTLVFEDSLFAPKKMSYHWAQKHNPKAGGYYVVYKDGYESYSPAEAFEEGYSLVGGFNFLL